MKTNEINGFKIGNFYLSELRTVVSLYKKLQEKSDFQGKDARINILTAEFGLPLAVIMQAKEVIGYASAIINHSNKVEMTCFFLSEFHQVELKEALEVKAKRNYIQTFGDDDHSISKLKLAIERLIDWLNL